MGLAASLLNPLFKRLHEPVYRRRVQVLSDLILPHLRAGDRVLDVGCGFGGLGDALLKHADCPAGLQLQGLERVKRGNELIPVEAFDGRNIPHPDASFDAVILADVLHHDPEPDLLIAQCARVSRRLLIIKDHKVDGPLAQPRISLMDWAANTAYGVPCLYQYPTLNQWRQTHAHHRLHPLAEHTRIALYPPPYPLLFTPRLQYLAILSVDPPTA